mgnify:CR=1 FL=1
MCLRPRHTRPDNFNKHVAASQLLRKLQIKSLLLLRELLNAYVPKDRPPTGSKAPSCTFAFPARRLAALAAEVCETLTEALAARGWRVLSERQALAGDEPLVGAGRTVIEASAAGRWRLSDSRWKLIVSRDPSRSSRY